MRLRLSIFMLGFFALSNCGVSGFSSPFGGTGVDYEPPSTSPREDRGRDGSHESHSET
jgi:hypothetical protein